MSEDMAMSDTIVEDQKLNGDELAAASAVEAEQVPSEPQTELPEKSDDKSPISFDVDIPIKKEECEELQDEKHDIKCSASIAFSDTETSSEEFKGFEGVTLNESTNEYSRILERIEAEVSQASEDFTPVKIVSAVPIALVRPMKRSRQDTEGSRPSSALSSRSEGDGFNDAASSTSSPSGRRRTAAEVSSPLLKVPLQYGWRRELVYRAALDAYARRNADIYYYTPQGKKLRSSREIAEHLAGTGLTLDNFSFCKESLGIDDPDKEIIRDAKVMRRVESPVPSPAPVTPALEGKRTPKPKAPKGASPDPPQPTSAIKSPPIKIKVKSLGSRLSNNGGPAPATKQQPKRVAATTQQQNNSDNNNTAAWKKPRQPPPPPPPLQSRPAPTAAAQHHASPDAQSGRQLVQPCSMSCGRGAVPSLACGACLCLYHPACVGYSHHAPPERFLCKNCRKSSSPPLDPPPLTHKSGVTAGSVPLATPIPRRVPVPVPVPVPAKVPRQDKRVLLRMKVAGGGPDGERVWAVTKPMGAAGSGSGSGSTSGPGARSAALAGAGTLPQSIAVLNGRRFIVVPRSVVHGTQHEEKRRGRMANGAASPPVASVASPRRRGRPRVDDTDHFTAFYNRAHEKNYNVVVQIFQYLGMRELAHCARVCRLWRQLAATPALWRHVRMKNSHVSDWGGLCAALKRHGTKRLDLRKMLLPQDDAHFWEQFAQHIATVDTLERIEICRCPARAVEAVCHGISGLRSLSALAIRDALLDPAPLGALPLLHELRLKSMSGLSLTRDLRPLEALTHLQHLSLTSIKELGWCACDVIGQLSQLESLELGECTFQAEFGLVLSKLTRLRRLRLERGTAQCAAPALLRALATLPLLTRLELVNFDVKVGFDDALAECKNIQRLLIIPTYVSQSATTNKQVLSGVLRLKDTLTHLMWGVTIELLRVTELFIDQCEQGGDAKRRDLGECIPVLKPVPGCRLPDDHRHVAGPPQVEILPLPTLQRLLSAQLPNTKLKLLRIPFHATWRQSLADFQ